MASAYVLTPNAVARRQRYVDWAERAERERKRRALKRHSLVVGVPLALLAGAAALTLGDIPARIAGTAEEVSITAPAAIPSVPTAMEARMTPRAAPLASAEIASPAARAEEPTAQRHLIRATGRTAPGTINRARPAEPVLVQGAQRGDGNGARSGAALPEDQVDRLAALDAIRDLRLR